MRGDITDMKKIIIPVVCVLYWIVLSSCVNNREEGMDKNILLTEDATSLLRNPCMGWGVYDDANNEVQNAEEYWAAQDRAAREYASFFYVRWRWSDMEPQEGKYAWIYDDNYKKLIQGALDRGLKLCFRIYDNGQDNIRPGTPNFVRKAGAKGYTVHWGELEHWTPYPDDPVFQEKLSNFVKAFAEEYDNPDMVDFIDGYALGWWGECHHVELLNPSNLEEIFDWYTTLYSSNFKNIILALPFGSQVGFDAEKRIAIDKKGYAMRRDGLGSMWFSEEEKQITEQMFGKTLFIGESCWWGCSTEDCKPFAFDTKYELNSWRDVYELTYMHAIENHFNTLDLRELPETKGWTEIAPDLVHNFIMNGGYRLFPAEIVIPNKIVKGNKVQIKHTWVNRATGYLPNNNLNWNYKYKVAFGLLDQNNNITQLWIDDNAEPSNWFKGGEYNYNLNIEVGNIPAGEYKWCLAIVDSTKNYTPGIALAVEKKYDINGWTFLQNVIVNDPDN